MWSPSWAARWRTKTAALCLLLCLLAGCGSSPAPLTDVATLTLNPLVPTRTPTPLPPTATRSALPAPGDIVIPTSTPAGDSADDLAGLDPVAADLVRLAQQRLSEDLDLPLALVRVVEVVAYRWPDSSLGCPLPNQRYTPVEIDGYRIVLRAGDRETIFHSDFDRVLPCAAEYEQLPTPTEATAEVNP